VFAVLYYVIPPQP